MASPGFTSSSLFSSATRLVEAAAEERRLAQQEVRAAAGAGPWRPPASAPPPPAPRARARIIICAVSRWPAAESAPRRRAARPGLARLVRLPRLRRRRCPGRSASSVLSGWPSPRLLEERDRLREAAGQVEREARAPAPPRAARASPRGQLRQPPASSMLDGAGADRRRGSTRRRAGAQPADRRPVEARAASRSRRAGLPPSMRRARLGEGRPDAGRLGAGPDGACASGDGQDRTRPRASAHHRRVHRPWPPRALLRGVRIRSTARSRHSSSRPFGQRTSSRSTLAAAPRPKCTRRSFCEM